MTLLLAPKFDGAGWTNGARRAGLLCTCSEQELALLCHATAARVGPEVGAELPMVQREALTFRIERKTVHRRHADLLAKMSSRPEEFHLRALPEPCMILSSHTAPDVRPLP